MNPRWLAAADAVEASLAGGARQPVELLVDEAVSDSTTLRGVQSWLRSLGPRPVPVRTRLLSPRAPALDDPQLGDLVEEPAITVVVGGGAVIDRVKLASLPGPAPSTWPASRSGLVLPPPGPARALPLIAVPTTLGTGTEASAVAVASHGSRRLLVMDRRLRPTAYAHDPAAYATLPQTLIRRGLTEVLSRLVGPYVGDVDGEPLSDALCLSAVDRLVALADTVVAALDAGETPEPAVLAEVARLSAFAHSDHVQRPHRPWSVKLWALANECCSVTGLAKMPMTVALWPTFWTAITAGAAELGSADRLGHVWSVIRGRHREPLPIEPGPGVGHLLSRWGVGGVARLEDAAISSLVERVMRAWGAGLPMYHGVSSRVIDDVLRGSLQTESSGGPAGPHQMRRGSTPWLAKH